MAKQQYTASESAAALGISLDTLRRWDKTGRIKVTRDAVEELGLKKGMAATAIVKSTNVMVQS